MNEADEKREKEQHQLKCLVGLQEKDNEINGLKESLEIIPGQIAGGQKELEGKRGKMKALQAEIESLKKQRGQLEQDAKTEADHMAKTKTKLPSVKTNKEYTAILHETDAIKTKITEIEDKELEIMELLEVKDQEIPGLEAEFKVEEDQFRQYKQQKDTEQARSEKELVEAEAQRAGLVKDIDRKFVAHYDKIRHARDNLAVVSVKGETCQGCHQNLQPQVALEVRTGMKVHQCQSCDRFLCFIPETETESAVPK